jgi:hypothetical protein
MDSESSISAEARTKLTALRIREAVARDRWSEARQLATDWAFEVSEELGLTKTSNWKFFKRALSAHWFGRVENKRFPPGWSREEALQYAKTLTGRSLRISLFPENIACRATSIKLPAEQEEHWENIIARIDNTVAIEIFPESSTLNSICFRRLATGHAEEVVYEAGKGQAMFVFEQEQGRHPIVTARKTRAGYAYSRLNSGGDIEFSEIEGKLRMLIEKYDESLSRKSAIACNVLGIGYVSIEGYFDPGVTCSPVIVDLDLPFDYAFMGPSLING